MISGRQILVFKTLEAFSACPGTHVGRTLGESFRALTRMNAVVQKQNGIKFVTVNEDSHPRLQVIKMRLSFEFTNILGAVYHRGSIRFAPDGSTVFSPVGNKLIAYDLKANRSSALPLQVNYNIKQISIHPKSTLMLVSSEKNHLYIVSLVSGKLLHHKEYKTSSRIDHISFSPDGRYYCVCIENMALFYVTPGSLIAGRAREITPFRLLRKVRVNYGAITSLTWSSNSNFVCMASSDMSINVVNLLDSQRHVTHLCGHSDSIVSVYFANRTNKDKQLYSLSKNCQLFVWNEREEVRETDEADNAEQPPKRTKTISRYFRSARHFLKLVSESEESKEDKLRKSTAFITSSDYNSQAKILVVGYNTGHYSLYEMPDATLIYNLNSSYGSIDSVSINNLGDWIAFGSSVDPEVDMKHANNRTQSRLLVWEWQSKSHILDHVGSGATMTNLHECLSYSLDGAHVVSGNLAGRIKVWSGMTGEVVATFGEEHKGPIKAIKFAPNKSGKVIISASLDGTLRAYDLNKFKNFRTFQSPIPEKKPEFICLDIDSTGEFIAAGTYNYFEIYLYSLQTGKFLEYLTGHEAPVSGLAFSPNSNLLVSASWDCTIRIWNLFEGSKCMRDTITLAHEVITVAFRLDGNQFAASLSNGSIAFFNPHTSDQIGAPIEGQADLGTTHLLSEISRESKKYFISLNYSADGSYLIAAGKSNFICIYHTQEKILMKKIALTFNLSMDGVFDYISSRRRSEFGFNLELIERRAEERTYKPISLPGVRKGDLSERQVMPVVAVYQIVFSPTMRSFAAASTEGVLVYSLDVTRHFDPYKLVIDVTPQSVRKSMQNRDFTAAIVQSVQLNDLVLFREVLERTPLDEMESVILCLELDYVKRVLDFIAQSIAETRHLEYYLLWIKRLLYRHGMTLKSLPSNIITPTMRSLHQNCHRLSMDLKRNGDFCRYSLDYLTSGSEFSTTETPQNDDMDVDDHQ